MSATRSVVAVIAEPRRGKILDVVPVGERSVTEVVDEVGTAQLGVSPRLKGLGDVDMAEVRRDPRRCLYRLRSELLILVKGSPR